MGVGRRVGRSSNPVWLLSMAVAIAAGACGRGSVESESDHTLAALQRCAVNALVNGATTCDCDGGPCGDGGVDAGPDGGPDGGPPPDAGPDGGLDGGTDPDGGTDGGLPGDGGSDGGASDGGSSDGGMDDGGTGGGGDAGTGDGGTGDGDGGTTDGGTGGNDGGSGDGGAGDGGAGSDGGSGDDGGSPPWDGGSGGGGGGGGGGGDGGPGCTCSAGVCSNSNGDTCLDLKVVPVNRDTGEIESTPALLISTPRPVVQIQSASLTVQGVVPSASGITGYLFLQGYVLSGVADTTPDATIDSVRLYVAERPDPIIVPLQVFKSSGGALGAPYPYYGILQAVIPLDGLLPDTVGDAWIHFRVEASDPVGHGVGAVSFRVDLTALNEDELPQQLYASTPEPLFQDSDDDTHPSVIRVSGPDELLSSSDFTVETFDGQRRVIQWDDGNYYVATREGDRPEVVLAVPNEDGNEGDWLDDGEGYGGYGPAARTLAGAQGSPGSVRGALRAGPGPGGAAFGGGGIIDSGRFLAGFVVGFGQGGVDLVTGTVKLAVAIPRNTWWLITHPRAAFNQAWDLGAATGNFIWQLGRVILLLQSEQQGFIARLVAGDPNALQISDPNLRTAIQLAAELVQDAFNEFLDMDAYDAGKLVGRGMFEVAAFVAPWAKAGKLAEISKLRFLEEVQAGRISLFRSPAVQQKCQRLIGIFQRIAGMCSLCLPGNTPVLTPEGLVPIARLQAGDQVISRDPLTGDQAPRSVLGRVSTAPRLLVHVRYRLLEPVTPAEARWAGTVAHRSARGRSQPEDDEPPLEIASTASHPFWVEQKQAFVDAEALVPGDVLRLANGGSAEVTGIDVEEAPRGQHFVAYNIEVDDYHTYFAGKDALWVHNPFRCEQFYRVWTAVEVDLVARFANVHPWFNFQMTLQYWRWGGIPAENVQKLVRAFSLTYGDLLPTMRYGDWLGSQAPLIQYLKTQGLQAHHWWPVNDLGRGAQISGVFTDGASIAVATPVLHTTLETGSIHARMVEYLPRRLGVRTFAQAKERFATLAQGEEQLFRAQQQVLTDFYKQVFNMDMPQSTFIPNRPDLNFGRGFFGGAIPPPP
jgi:hypothetical protein